MTPLDSKMPEKLSRLPELAYNLWWSWNQDGRTLFKQLDLTLWRSSNHNPVQMLKEISTETLEAAAKDSLFYSHYKKALIVYDKGMETDHSWFHQTYPEHKDMVIAYFSAEFGLHNSLPIYSGGLGILSGDHAKESGDLGIPLIGVGFMYPQGYFRQRIPTHGWQEAVYEQLDLNQAPIVLVTDENGQEIKISVQVGDQEVYARIWKVKVGRTKLYLMDTDVDENYAPNRELSARLYSGDSDLRLRQEIMLGIGGVRMLRRLGIVPDMWHMNEGHSAFLVLECIREKVAEGMSFQEAANEIKAASLFTTHTPVPAGHDTFPFHMMERYFAGFWDELGISREEFFNLGKHEEEWGVAFNMTVLALRMAGQANGVSKLHGQISRDMWQGVWPDKAPEDTPITHVTNGIHVPTWLPSEAIDLYRKYFGSNWFESHDDPAIWERLDDIPDEELWGLHQDLKRKMVSFFRERVRRSWVEGRNDPTHIVTSGTMLDPEALTIGFARRFATYKRAMLIFSDLDRLKRIISDTHRPVQIIFAGKAHPADDPGKLLIQNIFNLAKHNQLGGRIAFVEDYDMHMARYLVQGVDVWLNTPRRPREASGTSGQKAALNGVPNLSILDGWWVEGYNGANGWAIGQDGQYDDSNRQDYEDAMSLYQLLEEEVVPLYYGRDRDDIPRGWVSMMRESIRSNAPIYSTRRMLKEYTKLYLRTAQNS